MSSSDAIIWNIEQDPMLRSTVMSVWMLDQEPTPERVDQLLARMAARVPRLRQRVVDGSPRPSWVEVEGFAPHRHHSERRLDGGGLDEVLAITEELVAEPFDRARPLWHLTILRGLDGGRGAAIIKIHHSIADGLGMLMMLAAFTDLERDPTSVDHDNVVSMPTRRETFSPTRRAVFKARRAVAAVADRPVGAAVDTARTLTSAVRLVWPNRTPLSRLMTSRSGRFHLDTRMVPVTALKAAGATADASVNDVFVTIVGDALKRYHWRSGVRCDKLRVHMPVNSRTARTADLAGNEFVPARTTLRIEGDRPLSSVRDQLARLRAEPALHHISTVSAAVHRLGKPLSRWVLGGMMKGVDVLASNVHGPGFPIHLAGTRIDHFMAFGPPAGAAINVTMISYDGNAYLGITTDAASITDRDLFLACVDESIADLVHGADASSVRHLVAVS